MDDPGQESSWPGHSSVQPTDILVFVESFLDLKLVANIEGEKKKNKIILKLLFPLNFEDLGKFCLHPQVAATDES